MIEFHHVTKRYESGFEALKNVSLRLDDGQIDFDLSAGDVAEVAAAAHAPDDVAGDDVGLGVVKVEGNGPSLSRDFDPPEAGDLGMIDGLDFSADRFEDL